MNQEMAIHKKRVEEAMAFLAGRIAEPPQVILALGTGLGGLAERMGAATTISYQEIPHFPCSTVTSHAGNLILGRLSNRPIAVLQGRFHFYEGYSTRELTLPIRVFSLLGARILIVSNASGGLNPDFSPGTIMIIRDHLNFIGDNPLRGPNIDEWGPRFPDLSEPYDRPLIEKAQYCAEKLGITEVRTGVYVAIPGPSLETPAETRYLRNCGADAVGMSTVPEVIVAKHAGLKVLGLSVVANVNDPENLFPILLPDIIAKAQAVAPRLERLIVEILGELDLIPDKAGDKLGNLQKRDD